MAADGILLRDSGYPLQPLLMTPFSTINFDSQQRHNKAYGMTRRTIERKGNIVFHQQYYGGDCHFYSSFKWHKSILLKLVYFWMNHIIHTM